VIAANGAASYNGRSRDPDHQRLRADRTQLQFAPRPLAPAEGLDDIGLTLTHTGDIAACEQEMAAARPGCRRRGIAVVIATSIDLNPSS